MKFDYKNLEVFYPGNINQGNIMQSLPEFVPCSLHSS